MNMDAIQVILKFMEKRIDKVRAGYMDMADAHSSPNLGGFVAAVCLLW